MADIIELILADHRRIRRLTAGLRDAARCCGAEPNWVLSGAWERLASLIEAHTLTAEEICWLTICGTGPAAVAQVREMTGAGADIREAIAEARMQPVGSLLWWQSVGDALRGCAAQLDRVERDILAGFASRAGQPLRDRLGRQWLAFQAARARDEGPGHAVRCGLPESLGAGLPQASRG